MLGYDSESRACFLVLFPPPSAALSKSPLGWQEEKSEAAGEWKSPTQRHFFPESCMSNREKSERETGKSVWGTEFAEFGLDSRVGKRFRGKRRERLECIDRSQGHLHRKPGRKERGRRRRRRRRAYLIVKRKGGGRKKVSRLFVVAWLYCTKGLGTRIGEEEQGFVYGLLLRQAKGCRCCCWPRTMELGFYARGGLRLGRKAIRAYEAL